MMKSAKILTKPESKITESWVANEANRCLSCYEPPCQESCPASIPIPDFIYSLKSGNIKYAAQLIRQANPLASICGAVCPEEVFCQSHCTRSKIDSPIKIKQLHSYATSHDPGYIAGLIKHHYKAAIIGSGPAGMSCAITLALNGIKPVIFEQADHPGGVPSSSIPRFRLGDDMINIDINYAKKLGVEFALYESVDNPKELLTEHIAVFMATGLPDSKKSEVTGSELPGVMTALSFLERVRSTELKNLKGKRIVIIGGGNVSLDTAAAAIEAGASEVHLLYRRGPAEMKVWKTELAEAQKRGVVIDFLTAPLEYLGAADKLQTVKCIRTKLTPKLDASGRRIIETVPGTEYVIPADYIVEAIGLESNYNRNITFHDDMSTSVKGIFAGGDWARGEGTIVEAVRDGKAAAMKMIEFMKDKIK